jgi:hypothetical protein
MPKHLADFWIIRFLELGFELGWGLRLGLVSGSGSWLLCVSIIALGDEGDVGYASVLR